MVPPRSSPQLTLGMEPFAAMSDAIEDIPVIGSPAALAATTIVPTLPPLAPKAPSTDALTLTPKPKSLPAQSALIIEREHEHFSARLKRETITPAGEASRDAHYVESDISRYVNCSYLADSKVCFHFCR